MSASHACTQAWQKVHSACWKSISGNPPLPATNTPVLQAATQSRQRVQPAIKSASMTDQGGRMAEGCCLPVCQKPVSNLRRDKSVMLISLTSTGAPACTVGIIHSRMVISINDNDYYLCKRKNSRVFKYYIQNNQ